jgi:hypothetical protein
MAITDNYYHPDSYPNSPARMLENLKAQVIQLMQEREAMFLLIEQICEHADLPKPGRYMDSERRITYRLDDQPSYAYYPTVNEPVSHAHSYSRSTGRPVPRIRDELHSIAKQAQMGLAQVNEQTDSQRERIEELEQRCNDLEAQLKMME